MVILMNRNRLTINLDFFIQIGAAVFLYDPCVDEMELEVFKKLAFSCLRMHIITPYKSLPGNELFSVVTYGNRLALNKVIGKSMT
jgi:hypothetical protein